MKLNIQYKAHNFLSLPTAPRQNSVACRDATPIQYRHNSATGLAELSLCWAARLSLPVCAFAFYTRASYELASTLDPLKHRHADHQKVHSYHTM